MNPRTRALALFTALLIAAAATGTSTTVHNGATIVALILLAAALAVGLRIAVLDERARTAANTAALAEGVAR